MIGVTVTTPAYREMAEEAVQRWTRHTGMLASIMEVENNSEARMVKMTLTSVCWFFDSDLWFVRDVALPQLRDDCVFGTPVVPSFEGRALIRTWAQRANIDPACWISGGFYGADWSSPVARAALREARAHAAQWMITQRDEEPLNVGFQRAGLVISLLPSAYNWHPRCGSGGYGYFPQDGPFAIHAGDVPADQKMEFLKQHTA